MLCKVEEKSEESLSLLTDCSLEHLLPETMALGGYIISYI
jgi:hypothetical protein